MKYRPLPKRRNPMATVVRKLKPKRIASAKAYRRHDKHKHALRNRPDYQNPGGFLILTFFQQAYFLRQMQGISFDFAAKWRGVRGGRSWFRKID